MDKEQMIEQRADSVQRHGCDRATACRIARAEIEREARLVGSMESARLVLSNDSGTAAYRAREVLWMAERDYHAEFAPPPQRTVEQIARDIADSWLGNKNAVSPLLDELAAALGKDGK